MASSIEAFERFWMWKKRSTLLKVTLWPEGSGNTPTCFVGYISAADETALQVAFIIPTTRGFWVVPFDGCTFRVGDKVLLVDREGEEFAEFEDTGKIYNPVSKGQLQNITRVKR